MELIQIYLIFLNKTTIYTNFLTFILFFFSKFFLLNPDPHFECGSRRENSVFDQLRLRFFFSPAPSPAPIKVREAFLTTSHPAYIYTLFNLPLINVGTNEENFALRICSFSGAGPSKRLRLRPKCPGSGPL